MSFARGQHHFISKDCKQISSAGDGINGWLCAEHCDLVERLSSEKDKEMKSRLEQLKTESEERADRLKRHHSDALGALKAGN